MATDSKPAPTQKVKQAELFSVRGAVVFEGSTHYACFYGPDGMKLAAEYAYARNMALLQDA